MPSYNHYQPVGASVWIINHNLNSIYIATDALKLGSGGIYEKVMPELVTIVDANTVSVQFQDPVIGRARIVAGHL